MTRYVFGFMCVCALTVMPLVGCSETTGDGGSGGEAGNGGSGGTAGDGGNGGMAACERFHECDDSNECTDDAWAGDTCQNTAVEDGTECDDGNECTVSACANGVCDSPAVPDDTPCTEHPYGDVQGACTGGRCTIACDSAEDCSDGDQQCAVGVCSEGACDSTPVQNGTLCSLFFDEGNCFAGQCTRPCDTAEDCMGANECTENSCLKLDGGSRCEYIAGPDGTSCAGGTCQLGRCQVTTNDMPCTEQAYGNAVAAGCGPYRFDCDGPTEAWGGQFHPRDVILDGGGYAKVEGAFVPEGVSVELIGFVVVADGQSIHNFGGDLSIINSTVTNHGNPAEGGDISIMRGALTLTDCTVLGEGEVEILSNDGDTLIANSTLSFGSQGSGLTNVSADGDLTVTNSTLRSTGSNPVIAVTGDAPPAMVTATIVDGECVGLITSLGYNIESPGDTCGFDQPTDQVSITPDDLKLGPLQNNGGPTETHALLPGSPAINQIPQADCGVTTDQRGEPRPETGGTLCDVGAFERQPEDP